MKLNSTKSLLRRSDSVELVKLQSEKDLLLAKVASMTDDNDANEVDECIKDIVCEGNCKHVGCGMTQLQRLNFM